jgi:hypothetical protein
MRTHEKIKDQLIDFVLGELGEERSQSVREHAAACSNCRDEIERLKALFDCTEKLKHVSVDENLCASADQRILTLTADEKQKPKTLRPSFGLKLLKGTFMKNRMTKLAAAAAIVIATGIIGISLHTAQPAWAIEQTIAALPQVHSIYIAGAETEIWTRLAKNMDMGKRSGDSRIEMKEGIVIVNESENITYHFDKLKNEVHKEEGINACISPWLDGDFFRFMKEYAHDWKESYGVDEQTGRPCVFVTCFHPQSPNPRSWWFEFDVETKLPVRLKQWSNKKFEGEPQMKVDQILYNPELSDDLFVFKIPEGATVITRVGEGQKEKESMRDALLDPANGMAVGDLSREEACDQIVRDYWQSVIDKDWETVHRLRPTLSVEKWKNDNPLYGKNPPVEILEIGESCQKEGCSMGPIVPCKIQYASGKIRDVFLIVMFRENEGKESCIIAGTWGSETY